MLAGLRSVNRILCPEAARIEADKQAGNVRGNYRSAGKTRAEHRLHNQASRDEIIKLSATMGVKDVSKKLDVSESYVYRVRLEAGIVRETMADKLQRIIEFIMGADDFTYNTIDIAKGTGIRRITVQALISKTTEIKKGTVRGQKMYYRYVAP